MYAIGRDKTPLRTRDNQAGETSKSFFRINRMQQAYSNQVAGSQPRKISGERKQIGILKVYWANQAHSRFELFKRAKTSEFESPNTTEASISIEG